MTKLTQGRRIPWPAGVLPIEQEKAMEPSDYSGPWPDSDGGLWLLCAPNGDWASARPASHAITEHEDGTVTFSPSIQFNTGARWHGYLERGVWREC